MRIELRAGRIAVLMIGLALQASTAAIAQDEDVILLDDRGARASDAQGVPPRDLGPGLIDDRPHVVRVVGDPLDPRQQEAEQRSQLAARSLDLQHRLSEVIVTDGPAGLSVSVETEHGETQVTPEQYLRAIRAAQETQKSNGAFYVLFNITRPWGFVWVAAGFLAQAMFTYRMILQWWASEKHKRSVVPVGYWWGSLYGGMLLFAYFVWRKDIVGYLGQVTAIFIYARNLVLIYRGRRIEAEGARTLRPEEPAPGPSP